MSTTFHIKQGLHLAIPAIFFSLNLKFSFISFEEFGLQAFVVEHFSCFCMPLGRKDIWKQKRERKRNNGQKGQIKNLVDLLFPVFIFCLSFDSHIYLFRGQKQFRFPLSKKKIFVFCAEWTDRHTDSHKSDRDLRRNRGYDRLDHQGVEVGLDFLLFFKYILHQIRDYGTFLDFRKPSVQ